jgi:N6-adenosine-specific RNA methylase IME4
MLMTLTYGGLVRYEAACRALAEASSVDEVKDFHDKALAIQAYARQAENSELEADAARIKWRAKERLGELLDEDEPNKGQLLNGRDFGGYTKVLPKDDAPTLSEMGITKRLSSESKQVAKIDDVELEKALAASDPDKEMRALLSKQRRQEKHQRIATSARLVEAPIGPFPLIYADPPWRFATYSEKGLEKAPDKHYPTLSDQEICDFRVGEKLVSEITTDDAALLMWCTSSNVHRALEVLSVWGFEFKSSAVWVKLTRDGEIWPSTGLVFRNCHELLLYGTKGNMPGPQWQPNSVFMCQRGEHSAKPVEAREAIERMYPDFDKQTRLELFCRESLDGWSTHGFEC